MMLLTKANRKVLPLLYGQENKGGDAVAYVKFFTPDSNWTWYASEFDPEEERFFGLVDGHEKEFGYFMLSELQTATGPLGLHIERDMHFTQKTLREIAPELFTEETDG